MKEFGSSRYIRFLSLLACVFALAGCEDEEKNKAIEDAEQSRISLQTIEAKLTRARKEISDLQELLDAVTEQRDALEARMKGLLEDQGKATATAQEAQEGIRDLSARSIVQTQNVAELQNQVNELTSIIRLQEQTISEHEALIAELLKTIELQQQPAEEQYIGQEEEHQDTNEPDLD